MDLFDQVSEDIKNAMKAKDKVALETLRNIKKFFLEAKTAPGANDTLTDDAALKIIQKLVKQGKDSAEIYIGQGRQDLADTELAQVAVMEKFLPKQMTAEELEAALKDAKKQEKACLFDLKVLPKTMTDGYEAWWNVGLAETSEKEEVRKAWKNVEKGRRESRAY